MNSETHKKLLMIFNAGLDRVRGERAVSNFIASKKFTKQYQLISIGKAACSMALGALNNMQDNIHETLVITKKGHIDSRLSDFQQVTCLESDHPIPSMLSIKAGEALIEFINSSPKDHEFIFLISGGASSLVEVLSDGVDLPLLQKLTDEMLASGMNIAEMNIIRRSISKIKGGRLLNYLKEKTVYGLLISDVPNDDPAVIGSGLLTRVEDKKLPKNLSEQIKKILSSTPSSELPPQSAFSGVKNMIIATLSDAKNAAADKASTLGYPVKLHAQFLEGSAVDVAKDLIKTLRNSDPGIHIWGGETSVILPKNPGRGGRNQHLALSAAIEIGNDKSLCLLSAGTDGTDGPTEDSGAIVDFSTIQKGLSLNMDPGIHLNTADSGSYLHATGNLITTGPTGTNVMDLVIALKR